MAHLYRLIAYGVLAIAACWVLLSPLRAHAQIAPVAGYEYRGNSGGVTTSWFSSPSAACAAWVSAATAYDGNTRWVVSVTSEYYCTWGGSAWGSTPGFWLNRRESSSCPANSTLSSGSCICDSGYTQDGSACVVVKTPEETYCESLDGQTAVASMPRPSSSSGLGSFSTCYSNPYSLSACSGTMQPDLCGEYGGGAYCTGKVTFSSSAPCTGTPTPEDPDPVPTPLPEPLPPGMCPGEVNGVPVNVPCTSTTSSSTSSKDTSDSSGNTGSETTSRTTTCTGSGSCSTTTTTTTTTNGVSVTKTETTSQPKGEFCAQNPGAAECGDKSSFGGSCASGFTCTGDPVQCASAKKVHELSCAVTEPSAESALYADSVDLSAGAADLPSQSISIGPGSFASGNALGVSACIADRTVTIAGTSVTVPFSDICPYLAHLRLMLLAVAWLMAFRIVSKG